MVGTKEGLCRCMPAGAPGPPPARPLLVTLAASRSLTRAHAARGGAAGADHLPTPCGGRCRRHTARARRGQPPAAPTPATSVAVRQRARRRWRLPGAGCQNGGPTAAPRAALPHATPLRGRRALALPVTPIGPPRLSHKPARLASAEGGEAGGVGERGAWLLVGTHARGGGGRSLPGGALPRRPPPSVTHQNITTDRRGGAHMRSTRLSAVQRAGGVVSSCCCSLSPASPEASLRALTGVCTPGEKGGGGSSTPQAWSPAVLVRRGRGGGGAVSHLRQASHHGRSSPTSAFG